LHLVVKLSESADVAASNRIHHPALQNKIMSADAAAALIPAGSNVGMSGFTGAGYPKLIPAALARRIEASHAAGQPFKVGVWTGASTAPELDGALAKVDGIEMRLPYQSDPECRRRINAGEMEYIDIHLSHVAQFVWFGFLGKLDVAVVEVAGVREDGSLIPSTSIGNNKTWIDQADHVILEVNSWQSLGLEGIHTPTLKGWPAAPQADSAGGAGRAHRRALSALRSGQGDRGGRDPQPRPQLRLCCAGR